MAAFLHLLKPGAPPLALPAIEASGREPRSRVTVVLLPGAALPSPPPGVAVRRLAEGDLDYAGLLDLIFSHDRVVTW
jgi:hypothetical protein